MILKDDMRIMNIAGRQFFHNKGALPRMIFDPDAIIGWFDGVDIRRDTTERPNSNGDFYEKGRLSSRLITITGAAVARTTTELHLLRDEFTGLLSDGEYHWVALSTATDTRYVLAGLGGPSSWVQQLDTAATWKMDLYVPDSRMYGPELSAQLQSAGDAFDGLVYPLTYPMIYTEAEPIQNPALLNQGNIESWPIFRITGDYPSGFKIRNYPTGEEIVYAGATFMNAPITIDTASGSVTVGGVDRTYMLTKRQWFAVPPTLAPITPRFIPYQEGTGWCDVTWRSAWV